MFSGYWQVKMEESQKDITTFPIRFGNFRFEVMPMGIINAPSTYQKMMDRILKDVPFTRAYLDDVIIHSSTMDEHVEHLAATLRWLSGHDLRLPVKKRFLGQDSVDLLGHVISHDVVHTNPQKVLAVKAAPIPVEKTDVRSLLGPAGYYRRFIRNFVHNSIL